MPRKTEGDLERALLAKLHTNPNDIINIGTIVTHTDFFHYGKVYKELSDIILKGKFDEDTFPNLAEKHGFNISAILSSWTTAKSEDIARKIKEKSIIRKVIEASAKAQEQLLKNPDDAESIIKTIQNDILKISINQQKETEDIKSVIKEYKDFQEDYLAKKLEGKDFIGIQTEFPQIDDAIDGLRKNHIWVIGGYTSTGKSAFVLNIVNNIVNQDKRVSFYSLEMSRVDILGRLTAINLGHSPSFIMKNADNNELYQQEANYFKNLSEKELLIHNKYHTLEQITLSMMKDNFEKKVDLFIVDYIQNISTESKISSEYEMMTLCSREFQKIAEKLQVPIILLSQVNNAHAKEGVGQIMGFKGSGGIGAVADFAIELRRDRETMPDEKGNVPMKAHIMKNRHGKIDNIDLTFNLRSGLITETAFPKTNEPKKPTQGIDN